MTRSTQSGLQDRLHVEDRLPRRTEPIRARHPDAAGRKKVFPALRGLLSATAEVGRVASAYRSMPAEREPGRGSLCPRSVPAGHAEGGSQFSASFSKFSRVFAKSSMSRIHSRWPLPERRVVVSHPSSAFSGKTEAAKHRTSGFSSTVTSFTVK